jgi:hypothetical protein
MQLISTYQFMPPAPTNMGWLDTLFYFGSIVFFMISLLVSIFSTMIISLFTVPNVVVQALNGILAIYLLISFIYLIRGVNE